MLKEHSPQYLAYLLGEVENLILDDYIGPNRLQQLLAIDQKAQTALVWTLTPDSSIVGFGDTDRSSGGFVLSRTNFLTWVDYPSNIQIIYRSWIITGHVQLTLR